MNLLYKKPKAAEYTGYNKVTDCVSKYLTVLLKDVILNLSCYAWQTISIRATLGYSSSKMTKLTIAININSNTWVNVNKNNVNSN